ncbi:MAG: DNA methyltransferase, partial [Paludibacteraceae bacterium]|nr:DNA methyltransferase [Paludibacteraceae bacterium]
SMTIWKYTEVGHNQDAKQEIKDIFSDSKFPFDTPKPTRLINRILQIATDTNSIILDSFAGSGTTAHAVLNLNKKDGGNRKFILVEMEDYAETITAERVKRVINGYGEGDKAVEGTGGGFDYFSLGKTIFNADGNLNEDVGVEKIREYIWYSETGTSLSSHSNDYFLGSYNATDYYFFYEQNEETILTRENIGTIIKQKAEGYIIYADACQIEKKFMETNNITFKRIPRDIKKL